MSSMFMHIDYVSVEHVIIHNYNQFLYMLH